MGKRASTASFICELPLVIKPGEERQLLARFEAGRRLYNAVLGEALRRQAGMRDSRAWQQARALKDRKARALTFRKIAAEYGFTSASLSAYGTACKNAARWQDCLGAHETQKIAERAFAAVEAYAYGTRGRPRFKGVSRSLHSIEAKTNAAGIRWHAGVAAVQWNGLVLPARLAPAGKDLWQAEALSRRTKFCRVLWRNVRGVRRWYVQLVQEGLAPVKHEAGEGVVGTDVGPSTIAVVGEEVAALVRFCPSVEPPWQEIRCLQRALDRSCRATNPHCFQPDGTWKRGARQTVFSRRYWQLRARLADAERRLAAERKRAHGELANAILSHGNVIHTERLSYKAFQKRYGRSVKVRAPGAFISLLRRKAESAGGALVELDTPALALSQFDHPTQTRQKKPLSQRWHVLGDGSGLVQRDVYSAFLARCVVDNTLHPSHLHAEWAAVEPLLRRAGWLRDAQPMSGPFRGPTVSPSESVARHRRSANGHSPDVVAATREPGRPVGDAVRTP